MHAWRAVLRVRVLDFPPRCGRAATSEASPVSVSEADMMLVLGETQESTVGGRQADISAAIERQYAYEQGKREEFGTSFGPQALDTAVALVTGASLGMATSFNFGGGGSVGSALQGVQLSQQEGFGGQTIGIPSGDQVRFPGTPEGLPSQRYPVPYTPPVQFEPVPGLGVGAILGGIIGGLLIPDFWSIDREAGPYDTVAGGRNPIPGQGIPQPPQQPGEDYDAPYGPVPDISMGPVFPDAPQVGAPPYVAPEGYDFGDAHDRARKAMEDQLIKDMTTPAPPAPAPAPAQQPGLPPWVWPLIGGLGAIGLSRAGRSRSSQTLPSVSFLEEPGLTAADVAAMIEPLLSSNQLSAPSFQTATGDVWDLSSGQDSCNCHSRSSRKRKCLAKAKIGWRSGPKKGRLAGTRCYRFAD